MFQARAKFDTIGLISHETKMISREIRHQRLISRETKMISRETKMISRETKMVSRETEMISRETECFRVRQIWFRARPKDVARKCRPIFEDNKQFQSDFRPIWQILSNFSEQTENQAHRTASKWFQARLKTMNKGKSNLAHEQSSDVVRANP